MGKGGIVAACAIFAAGILYIVLRWRRSPRAFLAMILLAGAFFVSGVLAGAWLMSRTPAGNALAPAASNSQTAAAPVTAGKLVAARVSGIQDGDTIYVVKDNGARAAIRLAGIDAPESDQEFGPQSEGNLARLLKGGAVMLDCNGEESYSRLVCDVLLPDGEDVCLDQVKAGLAWHYKQYENQQSPSARAAYAAAEDAARHAHLGLWADANPTAPWDFRHHEQTHLCFDKSDRRTQCTSAYAGPVRGNSHSGIYEWPGCPYYDEIGPGSRVEFANAQAAEAAGFRPAHNCP